MDYLGVAISQPAFLVTPKPILSSLPRRDPSIYLEDLGVMENLTRLNAAIHSAFNCAQQTGIITTETLRAEF